MIHKISILLQWVSVKIPRIDGDGTVCDVHVLLDMIMGEDVYLVWCKCCMRYVVCLW